MPIAKEDLHDGFVLIAQKGTYVSPSAVEQHGWQDKVDPDAVAFGTTEIVTESAPPPKRPER